MLKLILGPISLELSQRIEPLLLLFIIKIIDLTFFNILRGSIYN